MRICNDWLLFDELDTIDLTLNYNTMEEQQKHYIKNARRSYLHFDADCQWCKLGIPIRRRFISRVVFQGLILNWEFGTDVQRQLRALENLVDESGFLDLRISRKGKGPGTLYQCTYISGDFKTFDGMNASEINAENLRRINVFYQFHPKAP